MLGNSNLPESVEIGLQIALIAGVALVAFLALRTAVGISARHLIERRTSESGEGILPAAELERRVHTIARLLVRIAGSIIAVVAVLMALDLFGIDIGPAVAGLGVVGIAVGLGAQTLVRDWLAGIFVVLENQYSAGDVVRIAGVEGVVEDFSLRRTTLRDLDGTVHTVPNGQIIVASNLTRLWSRVNLDISVARETDIDRASAVLDEVVETLEADPEWGPRLLEPARVIRLNAIGGASATLKVLAQVRAADHSAMSAELRRRILAEFSRAGIEVSHEPTGGGSSAGAGSGVDAE